MGKILIVDDNKGVKDKYRRLLEKMKLEVLEAWTRWRSSRS